MPREYGRNRRVADLVQREVADLVQRELDQQRTGMITISEVDVSPDLSIAKIYFSCLDPATDRRPLVNELNNLAGHFRHVLGRRLRMRTVPRLQFVFDQSVERGSRLSSLIDSLNKGK
ncbi:MAG: 30S ribosome-binding factor RbfA [Gammaproteobacteria bacterium]|nr:30S ribosome-binding factor RbfA [Gammaproteobacteria bacterium]